MHHFRQSRFAAALLDPELTVAGLLANGRQSRERFAVHRNNVVAGLVDALGSTFPAIKRLLGERYFNALAAEFVRRQPPATPVLLEYGDGFADFLDGCAALSSYPYLADVARLERLRTRAFHAADRGPLDIAALAGLNPARMAQAPIGLHPSVGVLDSRHPVVDLWNAQTDESPQPPRQWIAQCALVWRQEWRVQVQLICPRLARFLRRLSAGRSFAQALATLSREPDAEQLLAQLLNNGVLAAVAPISINSIQP